uniref:Uncharacterized protein n=1 Tax=Lepeophtheirus salmonis TaxID=72036 RepID=A0A0K2TET9_LEPSM
MFVIWDSRCQILQRDSQGISLVIVAEDIHLLRDGL